MKKSKRFILITVISVFSLTNGDMLAYAQQKRTLPTPTPTRDRAGEMLKAREAVYEGYAKLFVLGHVASRLIGLEGVLPMSMNLDVLANQPYLADSGDVFVYRPSAKRQDIMWPLALPTEPLVPPTPEPTATPTPMIQVRELETPTPTPTMTPTPTEVVPPPLKIQAVSHSKRENLVMISDRMLAVGDSINGATITEINRHYARIQYFGKEFYVTNKGTVRPVDFKEEEISFK